MRKRRRRSNITLVGIPCTLSSTAHTRALSLPLFLYALPLAPGIVPFDWCEIPLGLRHSNGGATYFVHDRCGVIKRRQFLHAFHDAALIERQTIHKRELERATSSTSKDEARPPSLLRRARSLCFKFLFLCRNNVILDAVRSERGPTASHARRNVANPLVANPLVRKHAMWDRLTLVLMCSRRISLTLFRTCVCLSSSTLSSVANTCRG